MIVQKTLLSILLLLGSLATVQAQCINNLMLNDGFESGLTSWSVSGAVVINTTDMVGTKSANICGSNGFVRQTKNAEANREYKFRAAVRYTGSTTNGPTIGMQFLNNSNQILADESTIVEPSPTALQGYEVYKIAPAGTTKVRPYIKNGSNGACIIADATCLQAGGILTAACNIVVTPSNIVCNNMTTNDNPSDDQFAFNIVVTNPSGSISNQGGGYTVTRFDNVVSYGSYNEPLTIQSNSLISNGPHEYKIVDNMNPNCTKTFIITPPAPCSNASQSDISLPSVTLSTNQTPVGRLIKATVNVNNINNGVAYQSNIVGIYLSNDNVLDNVFSNGVDIFLNSVMLPTNLNNSSYEVNIMIPAADSLVGNKFLIFRADALSSVPESNENNNTVVKPITLQAYTAYPCTKNVGDGNIDCSETLANGNLRLVLNNNNTLTEYVINNQGETVSSANLGLAISTNVNVVNGNSVVKTNADGSVVYTKTIPASLVSQYNSIDKVMEMGTGYVLAAFKNAPESSSPSATVDRELTLIKTNSNFVVSSTKTFVALGSPAVHYLGATSSTRIAVVYNQKVSYYSTNMAVAFLDNNLVIKSDKEVSSSGTGGPNIAPNFRKTACGTFYLDLSSGASGGGGGGYYINYTSKNYFKFQGDTLSLIKKRSKDVNGSYAGSTYFTNIDNTYSGFAPDGNKLYTENKNFYTNSGIGFGMLNSNPSNDTLKLFKNNAANTSAVWTKTKISAIQYPYQELVQIGTNYFLINSEKPSGSNTFKATIMNVDCDNNGTTTNPSTPTDLALTMTSNVASANIYSNYILTIKVSNNSNTAATGASVKMFYDNALAVFTSSNVTQGTYDNFNKNWNIGTINAGASVTLTLALFTLSSNPILNFAQVQTASPSDSDSTPGNDTNQTANEDDEAAVTLNGTVSTNKPDLVVSNVIAPSSVAQGAVVNFTFVINNIGNATATGNYNIKTYLSTDNAWSANDVEVGVVPTGNTPVNYNFTVPATFTVPSSLTAGNYFVIVVADNANVINESNENNNTAFRSITVTTGGGSNGMDLNLTMTSSVGSVAIYSNYTLTIKVSNTGTTAASNVKVNLTYNASNAPYTSSTVTQGTYDNFNKIWTVGNIAAGANVTLTLTLFTLTASPIPHFAQVQTASPTDTDSTPGNDSNQTANEDDEASFTLNATTAALMQATDNQFVSICISKAYPNPTSDWLNLDINSLETERISLQILDRVGRVVLQNSFDIEKGNNSIALDMGTFTAGQYFIQLTTQRGKVSAVSILKQ